MAATFGRFTLDSAARQVCLAGTGTPVHLSPKAFDLLLLLVGRRPAAVPKADIHAHLWPRTFVSDVNLAVLVTELRTALGDNARRPECIRTVQRFGYAFIAPVVEDGREVRAPIATCWVAWRRMRWPLNPGENVLGRDPSAHVQIDAVGVSRRHCAIVVDADGVTLRDLSSKNGTFVDDRRIDAPVALHDQCEIRLGPIPLIFGRRSAATSTQTVTAHGVGERRS